MSGIKLAFMLVIGLLCINVGLLGRAGSMMGAIIDPASMVDSGSGSGSGGTGGNAQTSSPVPAGTVSSMIQQVFGVYAADAIRIANAESSLNPNAYNSISVAGSHAEGVFQILYPSTWKTTSYASKNPYDAMSNIRAAYEIFTRDGYSWREWETAPSLGLS